MGQNTGCLALIILIVPVIVLAKIGLDGNIIVILFFLTMVGIAIVGIIQQNQEKRVITNVTEEIKAREKVIGSSAGKIVGGDHPLLGSTERNITIIVSELNLIIVDSSGNNIINTPLTNVKAQATTQSTLSAMGIFLFGLLALSAKEKLLVLDINDPDSKEHYTSVFKDILNSDGTEGFADSINRQRYLLLTK